MNIFDNNEKKLTESYVMKINEFIGRYKNYPVLFIGSGFSQRYLQNSYSWNNLLEKLSIDIYGNKRHYIDLQYKYRDTHKNAGELYAKIGSIFEENFDKKLQDATDNKFEDINNQFYENFASYNRSPSRLKLYLSKLFKTLSYKKDDNLNEELMSLRGAKKNISSIITTNYDQLAEEVFNYNPLVGNDILLSNPYGSIYKIHGCVTSPQNIIFTERDYSNFENTYELIRAQLLSIFIHNPIIFIGYSINDSNIRYLLKTIFSYVELNSKEADKICTNFLLIEFSKESFSDDIVEHDSVKNLFLMILLNTILLMII